MPVTYGLNRQLITCYLDGALTTVEAGAKVIGPGNKYFEPMAK